MYKRQDYFDVFQTDPPYTEVGFKYYLSLATIALKRNGVGYIVIPYMNFENWCEELFYKVQKFLLEHSFIITDILPKFQTFEEPYGIISSIMRVKKVGISKFSFSSLEGLNLNKFYTIRP